MAYIKQGYGFNVGQDFARAVKDTPIEVEYKSGRTVYGWIAGDPNSKLGFLRDKRVRVAADHQCVADD